LFRFRNPGSRMCMGCMGNWDLSVRSPEMTALLTRSNGAALRRGRGNEKKVSSGRSRGRRRSQVGGR
jgi:hypothetical protein